MVTFDNTRMYVTIATLEPMNQETRATTLIYWHNVILFFFVYWIIHAFIFYLLLLYRWIINLWLWSHDMRGWGFFSMRGRACMWIPCIWSISRILLNVNCAWSGHCLLCSSPYIYPYIYPIPIVYDLSSGIYCIAWGQRFKWTCHSAFTPSPACCVYCVLMLPNNLNLCNDKGPSVEDYGPMFQKILAIHYGS